MKTAALIGLSVISVLLFTLLGRWWGSDLFKFPLRKFVISFLAGAVFLPHWQLSIVIAVGFMVGNLLRDSIFDLLTKNDLKAAALMTLRASAFLPLMLAVYYLTHGMALNSVLLVTLIPVLSRAPIQLLCRFIPVPVNAQKNKTAFGRLFLGQAEIYELVWCLTIGLCIVFIYGYK